MQLECCKFEVLAKKIRETHRKIVLFGAGAIGNVVAPEIFDRLGISQYIDCYLDNDKTKWGTTIAACGKYFDIKSPDYLEECSADTVILLNISRFSDVMEQLERMKCTTHMTCYIMPMMLIHNFCFQKSGGQANKTAEQRIPRKLHYMWLGGKKLPDNLVRCLESWKYYCPDYEIIEWNESNYDIGKHPFMEQAYKSGAFGFVPDYARLDILYNEGGLYLDTDVEIKRNIDNLLYQDAFCGVEKWQIINFGGLSGAVKNHPMIKKFLDARQDIFFIDDNGKLNKNTCGFYDTRVAVKEGYKLNGETQTISNMNIYAYDYFHPYDYMSGLLNETENTYSVHWFNGGWLDEAMKKANEESKMKYLSMYERATEGF
ncbi:MAG: hypothetical protein K2N15_07055 [Lachnospiraceae bacterium]|nr:hypothetical protein [Lachnospiraceae bacterium]